MHLHFHADQDYIDLLAWLQERGAVSTPEPATSGMPPIQWPSPLPTFKRQLADRQQEFDLFSSIVSGEESRHILLLEGPSNCGKTALMRELFLACKQIGVCHALVDIKGCPSLSSIVDELKFHLDTTILPKCHRAHVGEGHLLLLNDQQCLTAPLILGFDTYQEANTEIQEWIEHKMLSRLMKCTALVVIVSGQNVPDQSRYHWDSCAITRRLQPITNLDDWQRYMDNLPGNSNMTRDHIEAMVQLFDGNPGQISASLKSLAQKLAPV